MTLVSIGADRIFVGEADDGLGGEMKNDLGSELLHGALKRDGIADVAADVFDD